MMTPIGNMKKTKFFLGLGTIAVLIIQQLTIIDLKSKLAQSNSRLDQRTNLARPDALGGSTDLEMSEIRKQIKELSSLRAQVSRLHQAEADFQRVSAELEQLRSFTHDVQPTPARAEHIVARGPGPLSPNEAAFQGEFNNPQILTLGQGESMLLMDAIENMGGFSPLADTNAIALTRQNATYTFTLNSLEDPESPTYHFRLMTGDKVFVNKQSFQ